MRWRFGAAFVFCAAASLVPFLVTAHLPMADLPEHMAQIAIWKALDHPCYGYDGIFRVNWATPYVLAYVVMRALAAAMSVQLAAKVTVYLTILLLPLSLHSLLRRTDSDPWLALLGFPLAFGFSFYGGFLSFAFAIPVGIAFLVLLFDAARSSSPAKLALLSVLGIAVAAAHALVFLHVAAIAALVAVQLRPFRRAAAILAALFPAAALLAVWAVVIRMGHPFASHAIGWDWSWNRMLQVPALLFANQKETPAALLTIAIALILALGAPSLSRDRIRWMPLIVALVIYLIGPSSAFGTAFLFPRWTLFVAIGALIVLQHPRRNATLVHLLIVVAVIAWMAFLTHRFHRFAGEAKEFDVIVDALPSNQRLLMLRGAPRSSFSEAVPGPVFHHFSSYYVVRKGGLDAWSFASPTLFFAPMIQYRPGAEPVAFDHVVLRGEPADAARFLSSARIPIRLRGRSGSWWWFETARRGAGATPCPPLED